MKYKDFKRALMRKYRSVTEKGVVYFLNDKGGVVATENEKQNLIVMYVNCERSFMWSHRDMAAIAVAKRFKIIENYEVKLADVIAVKGLYGLCNTFKTIYDSILEDICEDTLNLDFKSDIFHDKRVISTMGEMISSVAAKLDIGIKIDMINVSKNISIDTENLSYGILHYYNQARKDKKAKRKRIMQKKDYKVYKYVRSGIEEWFWNDGYKTRGSHESRKKIDLIANGTNFHNIAPVKIEVLE